MIEGAPKWLQNLWKKEERERFNLDHPVTYYEKLLKGGKCAKHLMGYIDNQETKCFVVE